MKLLKVILIILLVFVLLVAAVFAVMKIMGLTVSVGRYVETDNGRPMLVVDEQPILLTSKSGNDWFAKMRSGDEILVVHEQMMAETFPAQTNVYLAFRLAEGTLEMSPDEVVNQLEGLGWEIG